MMSSCKFLEELCRSKSVSYFATLVSDSILKDPTIVSWSNENFLNNKMTKKLQFSSFNIQLKKWNKKDLFGYSKRWARLIGILEEKPGISYPKKKRLQNSQLKYIINTREIDTSIK